MTPLITSTSERNSLHSLYYRQNEKTGLCPRLLQTGWQKVNTWTFEMLSKKRKKISEIFSNTNSIIILKVWYEACCSEHSSQHFRPLPSSGVTTWTPAVVLMELEKAVWHSDESWCNKPTDTGEHLHSSFLVDLFGLFFFSFFLISHPQSS